MFVPSKFHPKTQTCGKKCNKKWYNQRLKSEENKRYRDKHNFGGNRDKVLERDGYKCQMCGQDEKSDLIVHHKDGLGRGSKKKNNNMENLVTLCNFCHGEVHGTDSGWEKRY